MQLPSDICTAETFKGTYHTTALNQAAVRTANDAHLQVACHDLPNANHLLTSLQPHINYRMFLN
jgi:hypothetical protein